MRNHHIANSTVTSLTVRNKSAKKKHGIDDPIKVHKLVEFYFLKSPVWYEVKKNIHIRSKERKYVFTIDTRQNIYIKRKNLIQGFTMIKKKSFFDNTSFYTPFEKVS